MGEMELSYAKCFVENFSMSEVESCARLTHVRAAQTLAELHSETVARLAELRGAQ